MKRVAIAWVAAHLAACVLLAGCGVEQFAAVVGHSDQPLVTYSGLPAMDANFEWRNAMQGAAGDCWLMASLVALAANRPDVLERQYTVDDPNTVSLLWRIVPWGTPANPARMYPDIVWASTVSPVFGAVSGRVPARNNWWLYEEQGAGEMNAAQHVWLNGPDYGLNGGLPQWALEAMPVNVVAESVLNGIDEHLQDSSDVWAALTSNVPTVAYTVSPKAAYLVPAHAYTVLSAGWINGERVVLLRNPWGAGQNGAGLGLPFDGQLGLVYVTFDDFVDNFFDVTAVAYEVQ